MLEQLLILTSDEESGTGYDPGSSEDIEFDTAEGVDTPLSVKKEIDGDRFIVPIP